MNAQQKNELMQNRLSLVGISATIEQARIIRLAQIKLRTWFENECNGDIQRDDATGLPYRIIETRNLQGKYSISKFRTPDHETATVDKIKSICKALGCHYYLQMDPRGCSLYLSMQEINHNYSVDRNAVACVV